MIQVGDVVMIRGDLDKRYDSSQLVDGKYIPHSQTGKPWTGVVKKINLDAPNGPEALVGGGWRGIERYEKAP
jgi:hypothetical protein